MTTLLLLKELYRSSFSDLENAFAAKILKVFAWLCFAFILVAIYAFFYRLFTGFPM
ncbi:MULTISPECIES: DUF6747 family protein [Joostella]|uniref:DUF6747 family protein n=1 Tax=Joostella TaxID=453850 RepID=UPI00293F7009|nr:DUF6747 family protein [Joostella atrarenae]